MGPRARYLGKLVRSLLTQQLGDGIANDPAFEAIASDVA
eukprot:gene1127-1523_t